MEKREQSYWRVQIEGWREICLMMPALLMASFAWFLLVCAALDCYPNSIAVSLWSFVALILFIVLTRGWQQLVLQALGSVRLIVQESSITIQYSFLRVIYQQQIIPIDNSRSIVLLCQPDQRDLNETSRTLTLYPLIYSIYLQNHESIAIIHCTQQKTAQQILNYLSMCYPTLSVQTEYSLKDEILRLRRPLKRRFMFYSSFIALFSLSILVYGLYNHIIVVLYAFLVYLFFYKSSFLVKIHDLEAFTEPFPLFLLFILLLGILATICLLFFHYFARKDNRSTLTKETSSSTTHHNPHTAQE